MMLIATQLWRLGCQRLDADHRLPYACQVVHITDHPEEHAREHRSQAGGIRGIYMTLDQAVYVTPILQGALFAFPRRGSRR
jgi:hypothetical protein